MAHYISSLAFIEDGKPIFESLSELDGKIMAWDEKLFSSLLSVGQHGRHVFVANEPADLRRIGAHLPSVGPSICIMERRFFEAHFHQETHMVGHTHG